MMNVYILLAILIVVALVVKALMNATASKSGGSTKGGTGGDAGYIQSDALFTPAELAFLEVLDSAAGQHYRVFGKVRVADVIGVLPNGDKASWHRAFNKISAKHFDFVLCRRDTMAVVAAIELNDASHNRKKRQTRDAFLEEVCASVKLPLIQIRAAASYPVESVRNQLVDALRVAENPAAP